MDHDRAAGDRLRVGRVHVSRLAVPVVEDDVAVVRLGDPDPEPVNAAAAGDLAVVRGQREVVNPKFARPVRVGSAAYEPVPTLMKPPPVTNPPFGS